MLQKERGRLGEDLALLFLERRGFKLIARNWRCHHVGEIDLVARSNSQLVFVEVKTRSNKSFGDGIDFLDDAKINKLLATAEDFVIINQEFENYNWRLDAIEVNLDFFSRKAGIRWYQSIN